MKHITDDDLTLLFYGEHDDPGMATIVAESETLSDRYDALIAELKLADHFVPPRRGDTYGSDVWHTEEQCELSHLFISREPTH